MNELTSSQWAWLETIVDELGFVFDCTHVNLRTIGDRHGRGINAAREACHRLRWAGALVIEREGRSRGRFCGRYRVREAYGDEALRRLSSNEIRAKSLATVGQQRELAP